jgi:nucleoside 2-deoxyribosyltransferase
MTITICGSMQFHREMAQAQYLLEEAGHTVLVPKDLTILEQNESFMKTNEERITSKIEHDFIREHFKKIERSDAILVLNYEKKNVPGYIGGNTFLEMGHAFGLGKTMYLLHPVPEMDYSVEMHAMKPIVLDGDLSKIIT